MRVHAIIAAAAMGWAACSAQADPTDAERADAAQHWRALARLDLDAAYAMLKDNHPAMASELGDQPFIGRVEAAHAEALTRIEKIDSFYGLRAMLSAFGNAAGDKHVGAGFGLTREYTNWPMFLVQARGRDFFVVRGASDKAGTPAEGARLVSCDGVAAEAFAKARIGAFHANWDIEAQRASEAWRLFVNDRNPFVTPPKTCSFEQNGKTSDVTIAWNTSSFDVVAPMITRTQASGHAGYGVRKLSNGAYWISMEGMDDEAEAVVTAAQQQAKALSAAPYVVVDVRGNGGGSSSYGDRLADILLGPGPRDDENVSDAWRVSSGNAAAMKAFAENRRSSGSNEEIVKWADETTTMLATAVDKRERFAPALPKQMPATPPFADPPGGTARTARVYILTDYVCFSSCLLMTQTFKKRGAMQVGLPTDAATRYMESRGASLPSRLASFSIVQKVALGAPAQIGPFQPAQRYSGDITDAAALERWIAGFAAKR